MKKILAIIAIAAVSLNLSACSFQDVGGSLGNMFGNKEQPASTDSPEGDVSDENGTEVSNDITLGVLDVDEFNPLTTKSPTVENVCSFIFEPLYEIDNSMKPVSKLADSSELSADGLTYTVHLKQNVTWHDGSNFTSSDVVNTIRIIKDGNGNYRRYTEVIESAKEKGGDTVEITFTRPVAEPDALMTFPIVRQSKKTDSDDELAMPIGTGPFKMVADKKSGKYYLEANEEYHGGRATLDKVNIIKVDGVDKFRTLFYANEIDLADTDIIDMSTYMPRANAQINDVISNRMIYVGFNTENKALSDKRTRRAISCMIDRDEIVTHYLHSRAVSVDYALNPSSWLYFDTRTRLKRYNSEAEILLEQAGWTHDSNDSLYNTFGGKMMLYITPEILVNSESEERVKIAKDISDKLKAFGIRAYVEQVDYETYQSRITSGNYDMYIGETEILPNCDISEFTISSGNYFRFASNDVDLLLAQMGTVTNDEEKKAVAIKLFEKVREESPFAPICFRKESLITSSKVKQLEKPDAVSFIKNTESWGVR